MVFEVKTPSFALLLTKMSLLHPLTIDKLSNSEFEEMRIQPLTLRHPETRASKPISEWCVMRYTLSAFR